MEEQTLKNLRSNPPTRRRVSIIKRILLSASLLLWIGTGNGCLLQKQANTLMNTQTEQHITDGTGTTVTYMHPARRVVTLTSADTDLLYTLGVIPVGGVVSDDISLVTQKKLNTVPSVGAAVNANLETIISLQPDMVFGIAQNFQTRLRQPLQQAGIPIFYHGINSVADIFEYIKQVGKITDTIEKANHMVKSDEDTLRMLQEKYKNKAPRILILYVTPGGVRIAGEKTYLSDVFTKLGAINVAASWDPLPASGSMNDKATAGFLPLDMEKIASAEVDRILIVNHTIKGQEESSLINTFQGPAWQAVPAIHNKRYVILEKNFFGTIPFAQMSEVFTLGANRLYETLPDER